MAECQHTDTQAMAAGNSSTDRNQFICGICMDNYKTPRYLPTCGHTFCENCLLTYASNLQQQGSKLECPVCRKPLRLPEFQLQLQRDFSPKAAVGHLQQFENNQVTLEWIQTFPLNSYIIKMMESIPKSPERKKFKSTGSEEVRRECDPCKERGEAAVGLKFCMDCQEVYCKTCTDSHKAFKMSRHHRLIDTRETSAEVNRADFFASFTKCPNHPEKEIELYCKTHDVVMCVLCVLSDHDKACDTIDMSNHDSEKLREQSEDLTSQMKFAINHLNLLQTLREENKKDLKKTLKEIREEIEQVRDKVVTLMESVVSHVTDVTKQIELENEDRLDEDMFRVGKLKELTEEKVALMDTIKQHGSDRHKFITAHLMKTELEEIGRKISEEDKSLSKIDAELKIADDLRKIIESTDVEQLEQVKVNENESDHKHLGAITNYLRDSKLVKIEEHVVRPNREHYPIYRGVAMLKDGRVILCDACDIPGCGHICLYNSEKRTAMQLKEASPYCATQIDDTHIAVCYPDRKSISIVTVGNDLKIEKTFITQYKPKRIFALSNGQLAVTWIRPPAFGLIDINGTEIIQKSYFKQDKRGRNLKSFRGLAVDEKRHHVMQSCEKDKAVYCFDFTGEPIFRFTDPGLTSPQGVALDKCGNIYVCEYNMPGSIYKLSPAGELISILKEGVPSFPSAICSDNSGTGFWVTQRQSSYDKVVYFRLEQNI